MYQSGPTTQTPWGPRTNWGPPAGPPPGWVPPSPRRSPLELGVAIAVALILAAGLVAAAAIYAGGRPTVVPASYTFPDGNVGAQLVVHRTWTVSGSGTFQGTVQVANASPSASLATLTEYLPPALIQSGADVAFDPAPESTTAGGAATFDVAVPPSGDVLIRYQSKMPSGASGSQLKGWAADVTAEAAAPGSQADTSVGLQGLTGPAAVNLGVGGSISLPTLAGQMSDGSAAPASILGLVTWTSGNADVAAIQGGEVVARAAGTATLQAHVGPVTLEITVIVTVVAVVPVQVPDPKIPAPKSSTPAPKPSLPVLVPTLPVPLPSLPVTLPTEPEPHPTTGPTPGPTTGPSSPPEPEPTQSTPPPSDFLKDPVYGLTANTYWYMYTRSTNEVGSAERGSGYVPYGDGGIAFYGCDGPGAITVHRLVTEPMNFHAYVISDADVASLEAQGYTMELEDAFGACPAGTPGAVAVYRLHADGGDALTTDPSSVPGSGWVNEGVAFYAFPS